ncbi:MAG: cupredoxin domain-containing protein [Acidimicrobiales bacterium]
MNSVTRHIRLGLCALALVSLSVVATACGNAIKATGSTATTASGGGGASGNTITIKNFKFSPTPLTVQVGTTITVHNEDNTTHTVTATDGSFNTGNIAGGGTATFTVTRAGTFPYICNIHQFMHGTLTVTS